MHIREPNDIPPSEITRPAVWAQRRELLKAALAMAGIRAGIAAGIPFAAFPRPALAGTEATFRALRPSPLSTNEPATRRDDITSFTNFYELGYSNEEPQANAARLRTRPWTVVVDGACEAPGEIGIEDILSGFTQEERIYRLRCVEAWSMVVPWVGFPLGDLLQRFKPTSEAKFVSFESIFDPDHLPGQEHALLPWPYKEGLRIDEAMHPLTILATGLYGDILPNQNGAPLRLVVPWKYGFKSIKSIVRITLTATQPKTAWNSAQPRDYGFYANVNPHVDHPRWSQARHRAFGATSSDDQDTLMFNGYADQVAHLYAGMDLQRDY
jgi:methionine sulfoxide reductase catalytic subunit